MDSKMDNIYVFSACMNTNFSVIAIPIKSLKKYKIINLKLSYNLLNHVKRIYKHNCFTRVGNMAYAHLYTASLN